MEGLDLSEILDPQQFEELLGDDNEEKETQEPKKEPEKEKDNNAKGIYIGMGAIYILLPQFFSKNDRLAYPESLFLYGEEAFLSKQIEDAHGILWYEPELEVVHLESVATSKLPSRDKYNLMKKAHSIYRCYFK